MTTKTILISSLGLRNLVTSNFTEDSEFYMIFGEKKIRMNTIYAEFISPIVSKLHQTDITARSIKFDDSIPIETDDFIQFSSEILTPDVIELFMRISSGNPIEIDDRQAFKLRFLSIIIGNEELFTIINENFPPDFDENNVSTYLECIQCCYHYSHFAMDFDFSSIINYIASNFCKVDPDEFLKIPRKIQYAIITNSNLKIKSEDSLFIIIDQIIKKCTPSRSTPVPTPWRNWISTWSRWTSFTTPLKTTTSRLWRTSPPRLPPPTAGMGLLGE